MTIGKTHPFTLSKSIKPRSDNVDQRISMDIDRFSSTSSQPGLILRCFDKFQTGFLDLFGTRMTLVLNSKKIIKVLVITPFTLSWYIYKCWIVTSWWGPLACFIFFLIGSLVNNLTLPRVVRESQMVEAREGDYRWQNARIRRHAENIALRKVL